MSKLDTLQGKTLELAGRAGDGIRHVILVPGTTGKWLQTGAMLGAARSGAKAAGSVVRRNPTVTAAAVIAVGAGLLVYAVMRRKRKTNGQAVGTTSEGRSRRVDAPRASRVRKAASRGAPQAQEQESAGAGG